MAIQVFEYLIGFSIDLLQIYFVIFSVVKFRLRRHIKYSRQCLITFPNASKFVKNTLLGVYSSLLGVWKYCLHCLLCLIYYICPCRPGKRSNGRQYQTGTTSDDEDDLDYEGALATFVQSTQRVFADGTSDAKSYHGLDAVDAPPVDEVNDTDQDRQSQAMYMVINSHDDMQLTVTPRAIQILSELSEVLSIRKNVASFLLE